MSTMTKAEARKMMLDMAKTPEQRAAILVLLAPSDELVLTKEQIEMLKRHPIKANGTGNTGFGRIPVPVEIDGVKYFGKLELWQVGDEAQRKARLEARIAKRNERKTATGTTTAAPAAQGAAAAQAGPT